MNAKEKKTFIRNLTADVRDDLLKKVKDMPDEWDGIELRALLAQKFKREVFDEPLKGKRGRDFRNDVIVKNL